MSLSKQCRPRSDAAFCSLLTGIGIGNRIRMKKQNKLSIICWLFSSLLDPQKKVRFNKHDKCYATNIRHHIKQASFNGMSIFQKMLTVIGKTLCTMSSQATLISPCPLTSEVIGAPQMTLQQYLSSLPSLAFRPCI